MSLDIDFNGITNRIGSACQATLTMLGQWGGRLIRWIQLGAQTAVPYFQEKEIAAAALIGVTIVLTKIASFFEDLCETYGPNVFKGSAVLPVGIITAGVIGFVRYTQMTLTPLAIVTISVATVVLHHKLS